MVVGGLAVPFVAGGNWCDGDSVEIDKGKKEWMMMMTMSGAGERILFTHYVYRS